MKNIILLFFLVGSGVLMAQDTYILSLDSKLTINGTSTVHSWTVTANTIIGSLKLNGNSLSEINIEVVVADILSERGPTMDNKMHAALKNEAYPNVSFSLDQIKSDSLLLGNLTIAGVKNRGEFEGEILRDETTIKIKGVKKITLQDFEIEPPTAMFGQIIVGDHVIVNFDLIFTKV